MKMPVVGLIVADEFLLPHIEGSIERLGEQGIVWYGLLRHPSAARAHMDKGITPLHLKHYINETHKQIASQWIEEIDLMDRSTWRVAGVSLGDYFEYEYARYTPDGDAGLSKLREILHWAACMTQGLKELLLEIKPSVMMVWNGSQYPHSVYRAVADAMGVSAHYVERG